MSTSSPQTCSTAGEGWLTSKQPTWAAPRRNSTKPDPNLVGIGAISTDVNPRLVENGQSFVECSRNLAEIWPSLADFKQSVANFRPRLVCH